MMNRTDNTDEESGVLNQKQRMRQFYRWHAAIYDITRWAFLFGRSTLLEHLPAARHLSVAEIGCGTGFNLRRMAQKHPGWQLTGIDVSSDMLARAKAATAAYSSRVRLQEQAYGAGGPGLSEPADLILFSYALTMFNPGWEAAIRQAWHDLKPGGHIAVVDFHDTPSGLFRRWMEHNHVRMDGHLLPLLEREFKPVFQVTQGAWGGLWRFFMFLGQK